MNTKLPANLEKYGKDYSPKKFWDKIAKVAKIAGTKVVYVALLLYYVLQDPAVDLSEKAKILGALGYFILPADLIPDALLMVGYTDDLAALIWAYHSVQSKITPEMKERAKRQLEEWFGKVDEADLRNL